MSSGMSTAPEPDYHVAVVGAGPVGMYLALRLGRAGHRVVVVDRQAARYPLPRAVHYDHEIARAFAAVDLHDDLAKVVTPSPVYEWRNAAGQVLLHFDWSGAGPSGWPMATMFSQPQLEDVLETHLRATDTVELLRGRKVTAIGQTADTATLTLADGAAITARYVVGCDGFRSTVRDQIGTGITDLGFSFDWLVVDTIPQDMQRWGTQNLQICDPTRPTTVVSGGPGRRRFEFMRLPHETAAELEAPERVWQLLAPWDLTPDNAHLERAVMYTFIARWADSWRDRRVLIAGDAAHQMPPFAGQGMCSGIRDATNLAWKLDLVLRGVSDDALLDTYGSERIAHLQSAIGQSVALGQVICVPDPAAAAERDTAMLAAGGDPATVLPPIAPPALGAGVVHPTGGTLAFQPRVTTAAGVTGLWDQAVGVGLDVLTTAPVDEVIDRDLVDRLRQAGVRFWRIVPAGQPLQDGDLADSDGALLPHLHAVGHDVVVVRPDAYLFGAVADGDALLGALAEALSLRLPVLT